MTNGRTLPVPIRGEIAAAIAVADRHRDAVRLIGDERRRHKHWRKAVEHSRRAERLIRRTRRTSWDFGYITT